LTSQSSNLDQTELPHYECHICRDTGFILTEADGTLLATLCKCREVKKYKRILRESGISEAFQKKTFDVFDTKGHEELQRAKKAAMEYVNGYHERGDRHYSIMFLGQPGSGKTHLAIAIANCLMNQFIPVKYVIYSEMVRELKAKQHCPEEFQKAIWPYQEVEVLLIDDLFKNATRQGRIQETDLNVVFEVINHRYMKRLPTIISSEYHVKELFSIDEALASRLIEMSRGWIVTITDPKLNHRLNVV